MNQRPIKGGYICFARKFIHDMATMPILDRVIWLYLCCKANHKDYQTLKRGQALITIAEIQSWLSYLSGYKTKKTSRDAIWRSIQRLRQNKLIAPRRRNECNNENDTNATTNATMKTTRGMVVTICDYDFYQSPENYESNNECNNGNDTGATMEGKLPQYYIQECNKNEKKKNGEYTRRPSLVARETRHGSRATGHGAPPFFLSNGCSKG